MRVLSINVGLPREVECHNELVSTAIHKAPVSGPVEVRRLNLAGDRQADLSVHGGPDKAVYAYSSEHYPFWRDELPGVALPWGAFGENLTVEGLAEADLRVGDVLRIGTAELGVTEVVTLYTSRNDRGALLQRALETPALPQSWRDYFQARLAEQR
jgi:MOSC domain-containing protein YiiM